MIFRKRGLFVFIFFFSVKVYMYSFHSDYRFNCNNFLIYYTFTFPLSLRKCAEKLQTRVIQQILRGNITISLWNIIVLGMTWYLSLVWFRFFWEKVYNNFMCDKTRKLIQKCKIIIWHSIELIPLFSALLFITVIMFNLFCPDK